MYGLDLCLLRKVLSKSAVCLHFLKKGCETPVRDNTFLPIFALNISTVVRFSLCSVLCVEMALIL
jgi:hypothetical protein